MSEQSLPDARLSPGNVWEVKHPAGGHVWFLCVGAAEEDAGAVDPPYILAVPVSRLTIRSHQTWEAGLPVGDVPITVFMEEQLVAHAWLEGPVRLDFFAQHLCRAADSALPKVYDARKHRNAMLTKHVVRLLCDKRFEPFQAVFDTTWRSFCRGGSAEGIGTVTYRGPRPPLKSWGQVPETYRRRFACGRQVEVSEMENGSGWEWRLLEDGLPTLDVVECCKNRYHFSTAEEAARDAASEMESTASLLNYR